MLKAAVYKPMQCAYMANYVNLVLAANMMLTARLAVSIQ
jgi:hypothetical protein